MILGWTDDGWDVEFLTISKAAMASPTIFKISEVLDMRAKNTTVQGYRQRSLISLDALVSRPGEGFAPSNS